MLEQSLVISIIGSLITIAMIMLGTLFASLTYVYRSSSKKRFEDIGAYFFFGFFCAPVFVGVIFLITLGGLIGNADNPWLILGLFIAFLIMLLITWLYHTSKIFYSCSIGQK